MTYPARNNRWPIQYVVRLLKDDAFDAGYIAHPSFVGEEELSGIRKPLSISAAGEKPPANRSLLHVILVATPRD